MNYLLSTRVNLNYATALWFIKKRGSKLMSITLSNLFCTELIKISNEFYIITVLCHSFLDGIVIFSSTHRLLLGVFCCM